MADMSIDLTGPSADDFSGSSMLIFGAGLWEVKRKRPLKRHSAKLE
jgi:hypothetical protein